MFKTFLKTLIFVFFIFFVFSNKVASSRLKFTNIVCKNYDPEFSKTDRCLMKAVSRDVNYLSVKVTPLQVPITDFKLRMQVMKRANGWKPFLYDITIRCNFTRHLNLITRLAWNAVKNFSNVKHDCPYNQIFEIERVENVLIENVMIRLPIPTGEYALFTTWDAYNITRGIANFYVVVY